MDAGEDLDGFRHSPVGRWVECQWNFQAGQGEPHPDDREAIARLCPHWVSAECVGVDGRFFVLSVQGERVRVRPFSIRIRPRRPRFLPAEWVRTVVGPSVKTELVAPVRYATWHVKRQGWVYVLVARGKRRRRWYLESELVTVASE